ncbi:MAG: mechanosensitive ion channel family protein [Wenzhouxiangellaceae bacterium]|nr:MAG: mechanosensitive ion channel family protein [Wenzhouxiangellaceae bacterium]
MTDLLSGVIDSINPGTVAAIMRALVLLAIGMLVASLAGRLTRRLTRDHFSIHSQTLFRRIVFYGLLGLFIASAMRELGFSLAVIMGAAGVLTVAIGFASQTTASNLISGLFLIGERSFQIGDVIKVGGTTGEVLSIDALSVKLRTFDNLFVRIPNETLIKSEVTTLSRFPIRRLDLQLGVAYKENIETVREVLMKVADTNTLCLDEPAPLFIFTGFGDSALEIQFSVWAKRENFLALRNGITAEIKTAFDDAGIEIPFPHRSIYVGEVTKPFPVVMVEGRETPETEKGKGKTEKGKRGDGLAE